MAEIDLTANTVSSSPDQNTLCRAQKASTGLRGKGGGVELEGVSRACPCRAVACEHGRVLE